ncbi:pantoate--beta-alanine ligase [Algoriphagus marinus]|uniref:pantoate--beta-alanine ligase n=1 Tax=Algoriphagus marinus TaxID=1925762 RepID=UPI00094BBE97|nr:pantoate--beta-alanine ligase [Algoriphagus marinus]
MIQIKHRDDWHEKWLNAIKSNKTIGFVPTMGALHEGHLELIRASKLTCDITVVSIFVNPTQFNNSEDFGNYPKTLNEDLEKLKQEKVDYVYTPSNDDIYTELPILSFSFGRLESTLEGAFRPGHFNGVGIVVSKLFNIIRPSKSFFGQKDLQQVAIIRRLVTDLSFDIELIVVPTKRETDGLAMSSRNLRLSPIERESAPLLFKYLTKAKSELLAGKSWFQVQQEIVEDFKEDSLIDLEYFELIHPETFTPYQEFDSNEKSSICLAAYLGKIRLIDNLPIIS